MNQIIWNDICFIWQADVIVNSTAKNLDLKNGAVSASLLKYGGKNLQTELSSKFPDGIDSGNIAVTSGHDLQCKIVIHTTVPNYDPNNDSACMQVIPNTDKVFHASVNSDNSGLDLKTAANYVCFIFG